MRDLANTLYLFTAAALAAGMLAACGSDDTCESASAAICKRACDCTDGPGCQVQDGTTIAIFDDESDCNAFYEELVCAGAGEVDVDWGACRAAASEARCVTLDDGSQAALSPVACGSDPPPVDAGPVDASPVDAAPGRATVLQQGQHNWALMSGPVIPGKVDDIGGNRRQIPVTETDPADRLTVGGLYILRQPTDSTSVDFIVSVRNDGDDAVCFIQTHVTFRDAGGSSLGSESTYVHGSISYSGSVGNIDSCLQPEETGYASFFAAIPFDDIAGADVAWDSEPFDTLPAGVIIPFDYGFEFDRLLVAYIKNRSTLPFSVPVGSWVLLDDDDAPLSAGLFAHFDDPVPVEPGAEAYLTSDLPFGALATGRKLWVQMDFEYGTAAAMQADPRMALTADERVRWYQVQRNQREEYKRSLLRRR